MDKREVLNIAQCYIRAIKAKYNLKKALLFGSFARNTNNDDSDIDIALVFDSVPDIIDMQVELMKLRRDVDLRIEPHPFSERDFNINDPVAKEIMKYGIEISG